MEDILLDQYGGEEPPDEKAEFIEPEDPGVPKLPPAEKVDWTYRPYEELDKVGVLDPKGESVNPFTGEPLSGEYRATLGTESHWSKLPINDIKEQKKLFELIQRNQIVLVSAGTGTGKSSQVPKMVSHLLGYKGKIAITIPTQIATKNSSERMAKELDVQIGEEVGYRYRGVNQSDRNGKKTHILFTTDGSILARLLGNDPTLHDLNALLVDEVHERSSNIDLILLLVKDLLPKRPDFKVFVISATVDIKLFKDYYPSPEFRFGVFEIPGKPTLYPVKNVWAPKPIPPKQDAFIAAAVDRVIRILTDTDKGDILVFLTGGGDLGKACSLLNQKNTENLSFCVEASGDLLRRDASRKELVVKQQTNTDKRKVVMSTDVTEASITIDNIYFVVDTGLRFQAGYDYKKMARTLKRGYITKASAKQRGGRTGRVGPGTVYHLYTEKQYNEFPAFDEPDIKTVDLSPILLQLLNKVGSFKKTMEMMNHLIDPPTKEALASGLGQLRALGCFTKKDMNDLGDLTVIGRAMASIRIDPASARSILVANELYVRNIAVMLYAILEVADKGMGSLLLVPRTGADRAKRAEMLKPYLHKRGDYFTMLGIYDAYETYASTHEPAEVRKWCKEHFLRSYPLSKVKQAMFRLMGTVRDVVAPGGQEDQELKQEMANIVKKRWKTNEKNMAQAVEDGEGLIRSAKKARNDYQTIFPPEKSYASLDRDTLLPKGSKPKPELVYHELFIGDFGPKLNTIMFK